MQFSERSRALQSGLLLTCLFVSQLVLGALLHLDTTVARRLLERWASRYLSTELRGSVDLGHLEKLTLSSIWLKHAALYDEQLRPVATLERIRVTSTFLPALRRWLTNQESLTLVLESVRADGIKVYLHPDPITQKPSLLTALEPDPSRASNTARPTEPYRVFLSNVEFGDVSVDSTLPEFSTNSARLRALSGQLLFTHQGIAASLKRFSLDLSGPKAIPLHAFGSLEFRSPARLWGNINATLGQVPLSARVQYQDAALELLASAQRIQPAAARELIPSWPLMQPLSATLKTHGPLGGLGVRLELQAGSTHAEATGTLSLGPSRHADFALEGRNIDMEALFGQALPSDLDAAARITLNWVDEEPQVSVDGVIHPGRFLHVNTPRVDVQGRYDSDGWILSGRSTDPSLPIRAAVVLRNQELDVDAQVAGVELGRFLPQASGIPSRGIANIRGRAQIAHGQIASTMDMEVTNLSVGPVRLAQAALAISFAGPLLSPKTWSGEVRLDAKRFVVPYAFFDRVVLRAQGSAEKAQLSLLAEQPGIAKIGFSAAVLPLQGPRLEGGRLELARGGSSLSLQARSLTYAHDAFILEGLALDGSAGQAQGSLTLQPPHVYGRLLGQALDLSVLSDLLGLPSHSLAGRANIELDVDTRQRPATGIVRLDFEHASVGALTNASGNLELGLGSDRLTGNALITSDLIDEIRGRVDIELAGSPLSLSSYAAARGSATLELTRLRLDRVGTLLGLLGNGLSVAGTANIRLSAERTDATGLPHVTLSTVTNQFRATVPYPLGRIHLENKEVLFSVAYRADTGQVQSDWVLSQHGQPKASFGLSTVLAAPEPWLLGSWRTLPPWSNLPFEAFLSLPRQSVAELGAVLGQPLGTGNAALKVWLKGPVNDAHLVTELQGNDLLLESLGNALGFDVQGLAEYTRRSGEARVLLAAGNATSTWLQVNGVGTLAACAKGFGCVDDWNGSIEAGLFGLPLAALPRLGALGFAGEVRGVLSAHRRNGMTELSGILPFDNFRVSGHPLGQSLLSVRSDKDSLFTNAKLIDGSAQIDFEAQLPTEWHRAWPSRRTATPLRFSANATGYDAGFLSPWVEDYVTDLAGELSGSLEATYLMPASDQPEQGEQAVPRLALGGRMALHRGKATVRALGLTLSDLDLSAQASSTATRTTIAISKFSASVGDESNNLAGAAVVELDGLKLKRLAASIAKANDVPLVVDSVSLATLTGTANVEVKPQVAGYDIGVEVNELEVKLPRSSAREVVGLTENPDIVVLQPLGPTAFRKRQAASTTTYRLRFNLGKKSRVTRSDLNLPLSGTPELALGSRTRPSGSIQLEPMGRLQLFGKTFVVERGQITFDPDQPSNPRLDVVATWRGPTHLITVQIQGKREEARLRLTSDPPLGSESQVMALLLGGGGSSDSTAGAGLGVGATLFNELLSDTALSSLEVRTSSDERHANYTAAVPIRDNLWFEATYQSPTNANLPGSSAQKGFSGSVDYRFHPNWSVRTEAGTLGAGADLTWQYRY